MLEGPGQGHVYDMDKEMDMDMETDADKDTGMDTGMDTYMDGTLTWTWIQMSGMDMEIWIIPEFVFI